MNWIDYAIIAGIAALGLSFAWPVIQKRYGIEIATNRSVRPAPVRNSQVIVQRQVTAEEAAWQDVMAPEGGVTRDDAFRSTETLVNYFSERRNAEGLRRALEAGRSLYPEPPSEPAIESAEEVVVAPRSRSSKAQAKGG